AGHGVAVPLGAAVPALGPAHHREDAMPQRAQPVPLLPRGELEVGLGPAARPAVLGSVEGGRAQPVLAGEVEAVADAQTALLGVSTRNSPPKLHHACPPRSCSPSRSSSST